MPHPRTESSPVAMKECRGAGSAPAELVSTGWIFLGRERTLCLPRLDFGQRALLNYSLRFFTRPGWRRWLYRVLVMPGLRNLGSLSSPHQNDDRLSQLFGNDWPGWQRLQGHHPFLIAARYGTNGPYQKLSVLFVDVTGKGAGFVKLALTPQASEMVARESHWLARLDAIVDLQGSVPQILQTGCSGNGEAYLMSTIAPDLGASGKFGAAHIHFLSTLGRHTAQSARFGESMESLFIGDALPRLAGIVGHVVHAELEGAWAGATAVLRNWNGPLVLAHRDFVPWNMYEQSGRLFVFDWEYAADRASPLHDFFHFHLMPIAASRWRCLYARHLQTLTAKGIEFARSRFPEAEWNNQTVSAWLLIYLLELVLFYVDSGKAFNPQHPVLAAYTDMIRNRHLWMDAGFGISDQGKCK